MELRVQRQPSREGATPGTLFVNDQLFGYTLEDQDRGLTQTMSLTAIKNRKIDNQTAIPAGRYEVVISFSNTFGRLLPLLLNVPGYAGVRLHSGNAPKDTKGCLLIGDQLEENGTQIRGGTSRPATQRLIKLIQSAIKTQKVYITIQ